MKICIIGWGAANILFAGYLIHALRVNPRDFLIVDPYHDGGALLRNWSRVISNTTYNQFTTALESLEIPCAHLHDPANPTTLEALAHQLIESVKLAGARRVFGRATTLEWTAAENQWTVQTTAGNFKVDFVSLSPGAEPRCLQTTVPQIPLMHALSTDTLRTYFPTKGVVSTAKHCTVFGSAHSGVLIVQSLVNLGVSVTLVYNTPAPFYFADEGAYDGVKQEAAVIAREILSSGLGGVVELIPYSESLGLHDALLRSDWSICACGFDTTSLPTVRVDGENMRNDKGIPYNPATGQIGPRLYGWGIAFPSTTLVDGRTYVDVSVPSFAAHILRQTDALRAIFQG